jgi:23S rRNA (guanine2445-N2)-methyltransferase / 23S rRNA (guanine2069-N7)-methyltransferase
VEPSQVVLRVRRRRSEGEQSERRDDRRELREVKEGELRFLVNLTDYLDTGLFLDDRLLRRRIRKQTEGKRFLNLFAYTCTASVAAAAGGAIATTSVDLSKTYLAWGRRNFELNGLDAPEHRLVRADVLEWLVRGGDRRLYDVIFLAPPTWSRSKAMQHDFDVQRDHARLLERCLPLLAPGGEILFTTNLRGFVLEAEALRGFVAEEITAEVTPPDFARRPRLRAWVVRRAG